MTEGGGRLYRLAKAELVTGDIRILTLAREAGEPLRFRAGQYAAVAFRDLAPRDYSMANRPDDEMLEFHIRLEAAGDVSKVVVGEVAEGEAARVHGPFGDAYLRDDHDGPILAAAGGTGLAPMLSIVETALARDPARAVRLYVGARRERDLYREKHLGELAARYSNFRATIALSEPDGKTSRRVGHLHEVVASDGVGPSGLKAYLAGPPVMVEAVSAVLAAHGVAAADIHADPFFSEAERARRAARGRGPKGRPTPR
jgi:CDP-4-dehydro-6-deoxyglucose reductase/ferredoxin-NAD(P)+ reductase (naphthalene dioxygenase ferredoxin-specific)